MKPVDFYSTLADVVDEVFDDPSQARSVLAPIDVLVSLLEQSAPPPLGPTGSPRFSEVASKITQIANEAHGQMATRLHASAGQLRTFAAYCEAPISLEIKTQPNYAAFATDSTLTFRLGDLVSSDDAKMLHESCEMILRIHQLDSNQAQSSVIDFGQYLNSDFINILKFGADLVRAITAGPAQQFVEVTASPLANQLFESFTLQRLVQLEETAREKVDSIGGKTTEGGKKTLTAAFDNTKDSADRSAWIWTGGVFASIAAGIGLPIWALSREVALLASVPTLASVILKVAVGLPLFGLAAYCGHIAAQHRETSRHMNILSAQLNSVHAYTNELNPDDQREIIMLLGRRAFSDPNLVLHDKGKVTYIPEDVTELLKKAADALTAAQKSAK